MDSRFGLVNGRYIDAFKTTRAIADCENSFWCSFRLEIDLDSPESLIKVASDLGRLRCRECYHERLVRDDGNDGNECEIELPIIR